MSRKARLSFLYLQIVCSSANSHNWYCDEGNIMRLSFSYIFFFKFQIKHICNRVFMKWLTTWNVLTSDFTCYILFKVNLSTIWLLSVSWTSHHLSAIIRPDRVAWSMGNSIADPIIYSRWTSDIKPGYRSL